MNPDLILVIGIVLGVLSVPAVLSAFSDGRTPRVAALTVIASGALIIWAIHSKPGGYTLREIPEAFVRVVAQFL
jgi:hypothetical protein